MVIQRNGQVANPRPPEFLIKKFFRGWPDAYHLFRLLRSKIEQVGHPVIEVQNTQISFCDQYKYIWVWLPQTWIKKRPATSITMTFVTDKKIRSPRIEESAQASKGYWTHHVVIEKAEEIDKPIEDFISRAFMFCQKRKYRANSSRKVKSPLKGVKPGISSRKSR